MRSYLDLLQHVMENGTDKGDRTGTGTRSIFGHQLRFNLQKGFPMVTTKKVYLRAIIHELLWFIKGDSNISYLKENKVRIWNEWATEEGDLGPVYGVQWRSWPLPSGESLDQIQVILDQLKHNPNSRRIIVSAWNPAFLPDTSISPKENAAMGKMALPPCHTMFQFYVADGKLSCQLYQRSADLFLGVPFNIASYALLTLMIAQVSGLEAGDFIHTFGDAHIYNNHFTQVQTQLGRETRPLPVMTLNPEVNSLFDFKYEDFNLESYDPHPAIKAAISI